MRRRPSSRSFAMDFQTRLVKRLGAIILVALLFAPNVTMGAGEDSCGK